MEILVATDTPLDRWSSLNKEYALTYTDSYRSARQELARRHFSAAILDYTVGNICLTEELLRIRKKACMMKVFARFDSSIFKDELAIPILAAGLAGHFVDFPSPDVFEHYFFSEKTGVRVVSNEYGPISLNERTLQIRSNVVRLTVREALLLSFLLRAKGKAVPRSDLCALLGYKEGTRSHTVETHIYRLRKRLADLEVSHGLIETCGDNGPGYRVRLN